MNFKDFIIESWKTYKISNSPKVLLYDFYLLSYISSLILDPGIRKDVGLTGVGYSGKFFGREGKDLEEDIQYAQKQLLPYLGTKLAQALFIAVCAELRHVQDNIQNWGKFAHTKNRTFKRYIRNFNLMVDDGLEPFHSTRNIERPELPTNEEGYAISFKAAKKAIKDTGSNTIDFANIAADAFKYLKWSSQFGGKKWAAIARGYIQLRKALDNYNPQSPNPSSVSTENLIAAIDHAFDLEHNTGTVLNKVAYFDVDGEGYDWIKKALDLKKDASMYEIASRASSDMRKLGLEVLKVAGLQEKQMKQVSAKAGIPKKVANKPKKAVVLQGFDKKPKPTKSTFQIEDQVKLKDDEDVEGSIVAYYQTFHGFLYTVEITSSDNGSYRVGEEYNLYEDDLIKIANDQSLVGNVYVLTNGAMVKVLDIEKEDMEEGDQVVCQVLAVPGSSRSGYAASWPVDMFMGLIQFKVDENEVEKYIMGIKNTIAVKNSSKANDQLKIGDVYVLKDGVMVKVIDIQEGNMKEWLQVTFKLLAVPGDSRPGGSASWPGNMFKRSIQFKVDENEVEKYIKSIAAKRR